MDYPLIFYRGLKMGLFIKAKILDINPLTVGDDNEIIEQVVVVELPNRIRLGILDGFVTQVKPEMIGETREISLIVPVEKKTIIIHDRNPGIEPSIENPLGYNYHKYFGRIKKIGVKEFWRNEPGYPYLVCIDIGFADILVDLHKETFQNVKVGDFVGVLATMTNLLKIK